MLFVMGFYIGKIFVGYYGLMIVIGSFFSIVIIYPIIKKYKISFYRFVNATGIIALSSIIGSKILYIIINYRKFNEIIINFNLENFEKFMSGGFVFFGGLIMSLIVYLILGIKNKNAIVKVIDYTFPCYIICHSFGRIGCGIVGCCYGIEHLSFPYIVYTNSYFAPNHIRLFPTQYMEAIFQFIVGIVFIIIIYNFGKNKKYLYYYLIIYSVFRFFVEFYRGDIGRGFIMSLSTSQLLSIAIVIFSINMLLLINNRKDFI